MRYTGRFYTNQLFMKGRVLSLTIIYCMAVAIGYAQNLRTATLGDRVNQSQLIIEGKVTRQESFIDASNRIIYTAHTIEVYKVFKGGITASTIEVTTLGGVVGDRAMLVSEEATLGMEQKGLFLLNSRAPNARMPFNHASGYELLNGQDGIVAYDMKGVTAQDAGTNYGAVASGLYPLVQKLTRQSFREIKKEPAPPTNSRVLAAAITSFSPSTVRAGAILDPANNIITINGSSFGSASGSAAVFFDNPDDGAGGSYTVVPFNSKYIVSWAPTQIIVRVPGATGTGLIGVRDDVGAITLSTTNLTVEFSVASLESAMFNPMGAFQPKLMNTNGAGGYDFKYSTSTNGGGADFSAAPEKDPFERALDTWNKTTGVNFRVNGTTANQMVGYDGINTIELDNTANGVGVLPASVLGRTFISYRACSNGSNWEASDIDIVFRRAGVSAGATIAMNNGPCQPASAEVDFESVMLHELGHAHSFGHINDGPSAGNPAKVMNYQVFFNTLRRSPDASSFAAGLYSVLTSGLGYGTCVGFPNTEMTPVATSVPSTNDCPGTFPSTSFTSGLTLIDTRYATSDKFVDPSTSQIVCSGTSGVYNTVYLPFQTNSAGGNLSTLISSYTTLIDYSSCSGLGIRVALYQLSACPGGGAFPAPVDCRTIDNAGNLFPAGDFTGLAPNTNYLFVFDGIRNTKASFNFSMVASTLPVRLLDFNGKLNQGHSLLTWHTASEENSLGFELQRSYDGVTFQKISFIASRGSNSGAVTAYQYLDADPAQVKNFYRLKQVDRDGNYQYSRVVLLENEEKGGGFRVVQNPFQDQLDIQIDKAVYGNMQWQLVDISGRKVATGMLNGNGANRLHISLTQYNFSAGVYLFELRTNDAQYVRKLLKE